VKVFVYRDRGDEATRRLRYMLRPSRSSAGRQLLAQRARTRSTPGFSANIRDQKNVFGTMRYKLAFAVDAQASRYTGGRDIAVS
jgi:hypothetical protein